MRASASVVGWAICVLTLLLVATTAALAIINIESIESVDQANPIEIVLPISYAILGGLVVAQQPRNVLGWIFLAIGFFNVLPGATTQYTRYALITQPGAPYSPWISWFGYQASTVVYPSGLATLALLLMPNGRFLSPRWAIVAWAGLGVMLCVLTVTVLDPQAVVLAGLKPIANPTGIAGLEGLNQGTPGTLLFVVGLGVLAAATSSLVIRFRRSRGEERQQLRWLAFATAFAVVINVVYTIIAILFLPQSLVVAISAIPVIIGFGIALPAGFAVAILRYRLYDLDLLLNRTILYGAVTVLLLVFFVVAQRTALALTNQRSDLLAAALGLAAGLAFAPVRRWLRPMVDRALPARSRLTLLFTDIVESTQAIVDLGDERWREVLDRYRSVVRQLLSRHRGREVNTAGDAFFAVFDRPANGVRCAVAMRDAVGELGLRVRTGLHVGDVEMRGEQVTGLAVHATARVMGQARPGEIVVSEDLAALLPPETALRDVGRHELRGVPGEWQLYEMS